MDRRNGLMALSLLGEDVWTGRVGDSKSTAAVCDWESCAEDRGSCGVNPLSEEAGERFTSSSSLVLFLAAECSGVDLRLASWSYLSRGLFLTVWRRPPARRDRSMVIVATLSVLWRNLMA